MKIYSKDYPGLNVGDVIEVYSPDDEFRYEVDNQINSIFVEAKILIL